MADARRPLIGITVGPQTARPAESRGGDYLRLRRTYTDAVVAAGGVPVLVPPMEDPSALRELLGLLDGLVFPGGLDVDPARYGAPRDPTTEVDPVVDALELEVAAWTVARDQPVLGICRGQQLLNVALGGSLIQDLPKAPVLHRQAAERHELSHLIRVAEGSRLVEILGGTTVEVNSFHHQAVDRLGRGLRPVAWAPDGVVEGLESDEHAWLLTVQFHPEDLVGHHEPSRRLFRAFVEACRQWH